MQRAETVKQLERAALVYIYIVHVLIQVVKLNMCDLKKLSHKKQHSI